MIIFDFCSRRQRSNHFRRSPAILRGMCMGLGCTPGCTCLVRTFIEPEFGCHKYESPLDLILFSTNRPRLLLYRIDCFICDDQIQLTLRFYDYSCEFLMHLVGCNPSSRFRFSKCRMMCVKLIGLLFSRLSFIFFTFQIRKLGTSLLGNHDLKRVTVESQTKNFGNTHQLQPDSALFDCLDWELVLIFR